MSVNPFDAQIQILDESIYLTSSANYTTQVHIVQAGFAFILLLQVITLVLRFKNNSFWLYRLVPATNSSWRFIAPNSIILWTSLNVIFGACIQGFLYTSEKYATVGDDLTSIMLWRCLTWYPLWLGAWNMSWALFLAPILSKQSNGNGQSSIFSRFPFFINSFFIIVPFLYLAALLPYTLPLNRLFNESFAGYQILRQLLVASSANVNAGVALNPLVLGEIQELSSGFAAIVTPLYSDWSAAFAVYSIFIGLMAALYTVSAIRHFRSLGNAMKLIKSNMSSSRSGYSDQMEALTSSYRSLTFTSLIVGILITVFLTFNIILTLKTKEVAKGGILAEVTLLAPLYTFLLFDGISTISILLVSFGSNSVSKANSTSIGVNTSVGKSHLNYLKSQTVEIEMEHDFSSTEKSKKNNLGRGGAIDVSLVDSNENWEKDSPFYA